jgi:hypothetical protein
LPWLWALPPCPGDLAQKGPLLPEWHGTWGDWQWRLEQRRAARRGGTSDEKYIRQLSGEEPEP